MQIPQYLFIYFYSVPLHILHTGICIPPMSRNYVCVIDQILALIPRTRIRDELRRALESLKKQYRFTAPEVRGQLWADTQDVLHKFLAADLRASTSPEEWQRKTVHIFNGEE